MNTAPTVRDRMQIGLLLIESPSPGLSDTASVPATSDWVLEQLEPTAPRTRIRASNESLTTSPPATAGGPALRTPPHGPRGNASLVGQSHALVAHGGVAQARGSVPGRAMPRLPSAPAGEGFIGPRRGANTSRPAAVYGQDSSGGARQMTAPRGRRYAPYPPRDARMLRTTTTQAASPAPARQQDLQVTRHAIPTAVADRLAPAVHGPSHAQQPAQLQPIHRSVWSAAVTQYYTDNEVLYMSVMQSKIHRFAHFTLGRLQEGERAPFGLVRRGDRLEVRYTALIDLIHYFEREDRIGFIQRRRGPGLRHVALFSLHNARNWLECPGLLHITEFESEPGAPVQ